MKRILLALSALAIGTAAASAADLAAKPYTKAPPAPLPPPCIWCGFYIGLNGGWAGSTGGNSSFAASHFENNTTAAGVTTSVVTPLFFGNSLNQNTNGGFGGGQIGYNWVFPGAMTGAGGGWLIGVEADIQGASLRRHSPTLFFAETEAETAGPATTDTGTFNADSRLDWFGTFRGRLGLATGPVLFYGTGGLAFGGVRNNLLVTFTDGDSGLSAVSLNNFNNNNNNTRVGWVAGAGIEWMFAPNWSIKGEYQYIDLGSVTQTATAAVTTTPAAGATETEGLTAIRRVNERFNTVRIGVNYHFGGPALGGY